MRNINTTSIRPQIIWNPAFLKLWFDSTQVQGFCQNSFLKKRKKKKGLINQHYSVFCWQKKSIIFGLQISLHFCWRGKLKGNTSVSNGPIEHQVINWHIPKGHVIGSGLYWILPDISRMFTDVPNFVYRKGNSIHNQFPTFTNITLLQGFCSENISSASRS